jgi:GR25 family glycosyltransferase involved in LPS biosynthesis
MPKILYINLDSRKDRKEHIESIIPFQERFSAIKDQRGGYFGCVRSHIACLNIAKYRKYESVIILEDDFMYKGETTLETMDIPEQYDMLLLSNLIIKKDTEEYDDKFDRVFKAQWTSGYLIHQNFYDTLIECFEESLQKLYENYNRENYLDIYWNRIFEDSLILKHKKMIGTQLPENFSDIHKKVIKRKN